MTLVEITYELQAPLSNEQLQDLGGFANTYGLRKFRVSDERLIKVTSSAAKRVSTERSAASRAVKFTGGRV